MGKVRKAKKVPDHLTEQEMGALIKCAGKEGRYPHRDATMVYVGFRHGFRVSELCGLQWSQIKWDSKILMVERLKGGTPATHDMTGSEMRDLRRVLKESPDPRSPYVFLSERKKKMHPRTFFDIIKRAGMAAQVRVNCHPHILRHSCGFALANRGIDTRAIQVWLGHTNISQTVIYTALAKDRLIGMW